MNRTLRKLRPLMKLSGIPAAFLLVLGPWGHVAATASDITSHTTGIKVAANHVPGHSSEINMRVEVSYKGFNGDPDFVLEAQQGQQVMITFVWADTAVPDNAHRMRIEGYDIRTGLIDIDNREDTLTFIADKAGEFQIKCDWRCEGHKEALEEAWLKVSAGGPGVGSPALVSTSLAVALSSYEVSGGPVELTASLADSDGAPIEDAQVRFYLAADLAGTHGEMEIGAAATDVSGQAAISYSPTTTGEQTVTARFGGVGLYSESEQEITLNVLDASPAYTVGPAGLQSLRDWAPVGVALVVLGVWGTFGFVLYQVFRLAKARG